MSNTSIDEIPEIHKNLRRGFQTGKTRNIEYRKYLLLQLVYMIKDNTKGIEDALKADLNRPAFETFISEIGSVLAEIMDNYRNVEKWARPEKAPFNFNWRPMSPVIYKEPKGIVLVIMPFNYPVLLSMCPLAGALAAGNTVLLKPSENAPAIATLFAELIPKYFPEDVVRVVNGGIPETTKLLELPWNHILYTGSGRVGRIVATAAAQHLTPVTLELGGKSPVIIDPDCDLHTATRRVLWGKILNAGQTCVAPDYILVPRHFQDTFVEALLKAYREFYPAGPGANPDIFSRLITPQAFRRVKSLLDTTAGDIVIGGETDETTKYIAPTIVKNVQGDDSLMSQEIFGPVLPIVPVEDLDAAIDFVNARDNPLALYIFSNRRDVKEKVYSRTQSGAILANEVAVQTGALGLPFGGFGESGYGAYTGKTGFDTFTHARSSLDAPAWVDIVSNFRFPPYTERNYRVARQFLMPRLPARPKGPPVLKTLARKRSMKWWLFVLALALAGGLAKPLKKRFF